jgi:hypothetical protein
MIPVSSDEYDSALKTNSHPGNSKVNISFRKKEFLVSKI